ncbi:chymotrypsin-related [Holotrichia oblita]|uniref:Chymotrypsin-related n=1 Tax=Holotrichia oblita TaxID=644536 RepID=A0ACB9TU57_HOLOL|nr:chymotrypsin-related [Holotrichia oblita]
MVPGAERKLREHQRLHAEYTEKHLCSGQQRQQYDSIRLDRPKYEAECGPLLNKTPPDVCTMNKCIDFVDTTDTNTNSALLSGIIEPDFTETNSLAGQTVPITVKNHHGSTLIHHQTSLSSYSNFSVNKYGTLPHLNTGAAVLPYIRVSSAFPI